MGGGGGLYFAVTFFAVTSMARWVLLLMSEIFDILWYPGINIKYIYEPTKSTMMAHLFYQDNITHITHIELQANDINLCIYVFQSNANNDLQYHEYDIEWLWKVKLKVIPF